MSFKPEVSTDGGRTFHQNALNVTIQRLMELKA